MYNKMKYNIFYVYCHRKKTDGKCFYIGKGTRDRYQSKSSRNQHWWNIVNKHDFETEILINNISEQKAFELESYFCTQIGYENLCNIRTENGWGGYIMSESTKEKLSNALTGRFISTETKQKISKSNTGKTRSKEFKSQISQRQTGHSCYQDPQRNQKISQALKGIKRSEETKQNMKKPKPEGFGKIISQQRKGNWVIPQHQIDAGIKARNKVTEQYNKEGILINIYESSKAAAEAIGVHEVNMRLHLGGKYKTCKGYIFKYQERL